MLETKNKESSDKKSKEVQNSKKEEKGPMMNNFLDSRTKLSKGNKP